jgi:hypothetical protein
MSRRVSNIRQVGTHVFSWEFLGLFASLAGVGGVVTLS